MVALEAAGIPTVFVASEPFASAARTQSEVLGMPDLPRVLVGHPIQDRTDEEMVALADAAVDEVLSCLSG